MKKRVLSFLLALAMVLPYLAVSIPTASADPVDYPLVIEGLDAPVPGETPDFTAEVAENRYEVVDVEWYGYFGGENSRQQLEEDYVFQDAVFYEVCLYIFSESGGYVDGQLSFPVADFCNFGSGYGTGIVTGYFINGCVPIYNPKVFGIPEQIEVGEYPSFDQYTIDDGYTVVTEWTDSQYNMLAEDEIFVFNEDYQIRVTLYPDAGYYFVPDQSIVTDIDEYDGALVEPGSAFIRKVYTTKPILESAEVTIAQPEAGEKPSQVEIQIPEDVAYTVEDTTWFLVPNDGSDLEPMSDDDTFVSGNVYMVVFTIFPAENYALSDYFEIYCNGEQTTVYGNDGHYATAEIYFPLDTQEIEMVDVTGLPRAIYEGGIPQKTMTSPNPEQYQFQLTWYDVDWNELPENATFQMGNTYWLQARVVPQPGYSLSRDTGVCMDNAGDVFDSLGTNFGYGGGYVTVCYELYSLVNSVEVSGLSAPVVGQKLDFTVELPEGADYELQQITWSIYDYNLGRYDWVDTDHVVQSGSMYSVDIEITPVDARFSDALTATLNGAKHERVGYGSSYAYIYEYYNVGMQEIHEIDLSNLKTEVEAGDALYSSNISSEPSKYSVEAYWTDWHGEELEDGTIAMLGEEYCLEIRVLAEPGYVFAEGLEYKIDTSNCNDMSCGNSEFDADLTLYFGVYETIDRVDLLNVTLPAAGQTATTQGITVPEDAPYTLDSVYWLDDYGDEFTGKFVAGKQYFLIAEMTYGEYCDVGRCPVYVNGKYAFANAGDWGENYLYCEIPYTVDSKKINLVRVDGMPEAKAGGYVNTSTTQLTVPSDAKYSATSVEWVKYLQQENKTEILRDGTKFVSGGIYGVMVTLTPVDGYSFNQPDVVVNGAVSQNYYVEEDGTLVVFAEYYLSTPITQITITGVKDAVVGQTASTSGIVVAESSKVEVIKAWLDPEHGSLEDPFTGKFQDGGMYALVVLFVPKAGYHFAEDMKIIVNGQEDPDAYTQEPFYAAFQRVFDFSKVIDRVDVTVDIPEVGKVVGPETFSVPSDANYEITWASKSLDEGQTYMENESYYIQFDLSPLDGYQFAEDVQIYINGQPADAKYIEDVETYHIGFDMEFHFGKEISRIDLEDITDAVVGQKSSNSLWGDDIYTDEYYAWWQWNVWNPNSNQWCEFYGVFEEGYIYERVLHIEASSGAYFAEDLEVTINGEPVPVELYSGTYIGNIYTYFDFGADVIKSVSVNGVVTPAVDTAADVSDVQLELGNGCELLGAAWFACDTNDLTSDDWEQVDQFQVGKYHMLALVLRSKDETPFSDALTVVIDGVEYDVALLYPYEGYYVVVLSFGKLRDGDGVTGDLTGDDEVNEKDVEALLMYYLYPDSFPVEADCDYTGDGVVDAKDVEALLMYYLYPESFPLD